MKVFIQIVDSKTGIYQTGMIEEPVVKGQEIQNGLKHFGITFGEIEWDSNFIHQDIINQPRSMTGIVVGTSKVVNVICIQVVYDQPA